MHRSLPVGAKPGLPTLAFQHCGRAFSSPYFRSSPGVLLLIHLRTTSRLRLRPRRPASNPVDPEQPYPQEPGEEEEAELRRQQREAERLARRLAAEERRRVRDEQRRAAEQAERLR